MVDVRGPVTRAVGSFALSGLIALGAVAIATYTASQSAGTDSAVRDARRDTALLARTAIEPNLTDALADADATAVAAMDREVRQRVLDEDLVRVKLWRSDGMIVYSDQPRLVGTRYALAKDEQESFEKGTAAADVSDLTRPENRFERPFGKLLEVYQPVRTPGGRTLLFETYFRYNAVTAGGRRAWNDFAPIVLLALVGLEMLQLPLAWSMARRLRAGQLRQERLLQRAVDASDAERRRIAGDLHDGVVQDLASVSYSLASITNKLDDADARATVTEAAEGTRRGIRALRSLLVDIYPPSLQDAGLYSALSDLTAPLAGHGIETSLDLPDDDSAIPADVEALLYRASQEAVRNVVKHAGASHIDIRVARTDHRAVLDVTDDGAGFDVKEAEAAPTEGHVGLRVLRDLVHDAGGMVDIRSQPGEGTCVHVEVPVR